VEVGTPVTDATDTRTTTNLSTTITAEDLHAEIEQLNIDRDNAESLADSKQKVPLSVPNGDSEEKIYGMHASMVKVIEKQQMSEINPGVWDGLTPDEVRTRYPDEWAHFVKDPYSFRARRAESYHDLSGNAPIIILPCRGCLTNDSPLGADNHRT
jgi:hypothetical protein